MSFARCRQGLWLELQAIEWHDLVVRDMKTTQEDATHSLYSCLVFEFLAALATLKHVGGGAEVVFMARPSYHVKKFQGIESLAQGLSGIQG